MAYWCNIVEKNREEYPVILAKDYGALLVFAQSFNIFYEL